MKNLFEKLKPEVKEKLNSDREKWPNLINSIEGELKQNVFPSDLKYGTFLDMNNITGFRHSLFDYFND